MFKPDQLENIFFLDIETASATATYAELPDRMKPLWEKKARRYVDKNSDWDPGEVYVDKAAIHAEFGRVVCISCGYLRFKENGPPELRIKSFYGEDEYALLAGFRERPVKHVGAW